MTIQPLHRFGRRLGTVLLLLCMSCGVCTAQPGKTLPKGKAVSVNPRDEALAISSAFAENRAVEWRLAVTRQLLRIDRMSRNDLAAAARAYRQVAVERGVQGLESTLLVTLGALGEGDKRDWQIAHTELTALGRGVPVAADLTSHPGARVAIRSTRSRVIHFIPLQFARTLLIAQIQRGSSAAPVDLKSIITEDMCSPASLARFEARFGKEYADRLRSVCGQGGGSTPESGMGAFGPLAAMSEFSCLPAQEPARVDRVRDLLSACLSSQTGGGGSPFAAEYKPGWSLSEYIYNEKGKTERIVKLADPATGEELIIEWVDRQSGKTRLRSEKKRDGTREVTLYRETESGGTEENGKITYDDKGEMTSVTNRAVNEDGTMDEVVLNADNSYTVRQYGEEVDGKRKLTSETHYDKNGKKVSGAGDPVSGWARTPECRELTLELTRESARTVLESGGLVDPHTVNPDPEREVSPIDGVLGCLDLTGGAIVDAAFGCADGVKLCGPSQMPDADCQCQPVRGGATPSEICGIAMVCADGRQPRQVNGVCTCVDSEVLYAEPLPVSPRPSPVGRRQPGTSAPLPARTVDGRGR